MMLKDTALRVDVEIPVGSLVVWLTAVALVLAAVLGAVSPIVSASVDDLWATVDDEGVLPQTW